MVDTCWSQLVVDAMDCLGEEFKENELAYLALTSKVENPIRDRLAYSLHRRFGEVQGIAFAREWTIPKNRKRNKDQKGGRLDLAVLENGAPQLFLEMKSMYSFDMYKKDRETLYPKQVCSDIKKMNNCESNREVEKIAIILITDPVHKPSKCLDHVIKYNRYIRQFHEHTKEGLNTAVACYFRNFRSFASGCIDGGRAFGIDVNVRYWCFNSFKQPPPC